MRKEYFIFAFDCSGNTLRKVSKSNDDDAQRYGKKLMATGNYYSVLVTDYLGFKRLEVYRDHTVYPASTSRYVPPNGYSWS